MWKFISLGGFSKYYFFILGIIFVKFIKTFICGFTPELPAFNTIYLFNYKSFFVSHPLLMSCLHNFIVGLVGFILEMVYNKKTKKVSNDKEEDVTENDLEEFINDNAIERVSEINDKKNFWKIFLVFTLYFVSQIIVSSLNELGVNNIKFWPLEYIFLIIFSKKILNRIMYIHQKVSLSILIVCCTSIYFIYSLFAEINKGCTPIKEGECEPLRENIYQYIKSRTSWFFIPIIILLYFIAMISEAYAVISVKWLIDIQYITVTRILMYLGIIGFVLSLGLLFAFSYIPCGKNDDVLVDVCQILYENKLYYENFRTLRNIKINSNFFIDIFVVLIIYLASYFFNIFFELIIIEKLDPFYLIPIDCFYYLIKGSINYFATLNQRNGNSDLKFALLVVDNALSLTLSLIYFEIIELHFCGLDRYLRRFILKREYQEKKNILVYNVNDEKDEDKESDSLNL